MVRLSQALTPETVAFSRTALNPTALAMQGSLILQIGAEVRALIAKGQPVCNLTVGDFNPGHFPIPRPLLDGIVTAYEKGQTNYPPSEGIPELRTAIASWYGRQLGIDVSPDWIIVAAGARPVMYGTFRLFLEPGDDVVFAVPSWNNGYYVQLCGARPVAVPTRVEDNFFPTRSMLAPVFERARLFALNSPLNPTGTVISPEQLTDVARAVVHENDRRRSQGQKPLMWMWDQVYWQLTFGSARFVHPCVLVPEVAPYIVTIDAISKAYAATGVRVGWAMLPPVVAERMKAFLGHVGAWAPRPEQVATANLLNDDVAADAFLTEHRARLSERLTLLSSGLSDLRVQHLVPQGAIYLSVRFDLFGRPGVDGQPIRTNEDIRRFLLREAGVAVVPFQAFDLEEESGWFRMSVGAVSIAELKEAFTRLARIL